MKIKKPTNANQVNDSDMSFEMQWRRVRVLFKVIGPIGIAFALATLGYAFKAVFDGQLHWVTKSADTVISRLDDPNHFWLFTGILILGGMFGLWAAVRITREFWGASKLDC